MPDQAIQPAGIATHGAAQLTSVIIDTYNAELRDKDGFIGDRASRRAFGAILDDWRKKLSQAGGDPLGDTETAQSQVELDKMINDKDPSATGLVVSVVEDFAQEFAGVIRRFLRLKEWENTERIVIGGGFRESHIGEMAIGRTALILKAENQRLDLMPIRNDPHEAGLIGCIHLAPPWIFAGHDAILAADIGGSNMRAGIVAANSKKDPTLSKSKVLFSEVWNYAHEKPSRKAAVEGLTSMLQAMIKRAEKEKLQLAPFIGLGCPGIINHDGSIEKGGQNLPGNWEHKNFNLPQTVKEAVPSIGHHETSVVMHNDAVVQGLSEAPFMQDVEHWGVMTIGTGLGNARFTNRSPIKK